VLKCTTHCSAQRHRNKPRDDATSMLRCHCNRSRSAAAAAVICEMTVSVSDATAGRQADADVKWFCAVDHRHFLSSDAPANSMIDLNTTKYCSNTERRAETTGHQRCQISPAATSTPSSPSFPPRLPQLCASVGETRTIYVRHRDAYPLCGFYGLR